MSKHDHVPPPPPCKHEGLRFCAQCDAVECTTCGKEWKPPSSSLGMYALQREAERAREINPPGLPGYPPSKAWLSASSPDPKARVLCAHGANQRRP